VNISRRTEMICLHCFCASWREVEPRNSGSINRRIHKFPPCAALSSDAGGNLDLPSRRIGRTCQQPPALPEDPGSAGVHRSGLVQRSGTVCKAGESGQGAGGTVPILAPNAFGEASAL
jgi:hypothetical protein